MSKFYDKTAASFKSTTIDTKVLDAQKILVNTDSADYSQRVNLIDYIKENTVGEDAELRDLVLGENINKIFNTNTMGGTLDNASITAVQYSSTHFIKGAKLLSIKIPYTDNGTARNTGYLIAAVYDNQESQISLHYSDNTFTFNGDNSSATFTFTDFEIPSDYRFIRFALVSNKNTIPTFINGTNCLQFRCKPIKFNNTFTFDDDDCQVYNGSTTNNWLIGVEVESISREGGLSSSVTYLENQISDVDSRVTSLENKEITYDKEVTISTLSEQPTNVGQFNAIIFNQLKVPHDVVIKAIEMPITNNTTSDPLWLVAYNVGSNNTKTLISKSDNSQIVKSGTNARWTFGDGFVISGTDSLAVYIAKENTSIGTSEVAVPGVHIECPQLGSGTDTIRYGAGTYGRDCFAYFNIIEKASLNNVIDQIKEESETHITKEEADSLYLAKTEYLEQINNYVTKEELNQQLEDLEPQDIDTSNLAKLNTSNTFTGDIVLRGGKLILANGSQLEIEEGDYVPGEPGTNMAPSIVQLQQDVEQLRTDMTQADSSLQQQINNIPNLTEDVNDLTQRVVDLEQGVSGGNYGACDYNTVKEDVEYHLQNEISHMSFTDRIVMDNLYTVEEGSFSRYYTSNSVDNVTEFTDAVCSSFTLHKPSILLDTTLGVLQIPYSGSADVQCSLKIVCYDANTKTNLIEATSINVVDYSTGAGNANFFFEPFTLPFKTEEVVCSFVKADGTNVQAPVKLVTTTPTNGDQYNNQDTYVDGRVYVIQYTPAVHINTFIRDLDDCRWPMLTLQDDGSYSIDFYTVIGMQSVSLTPHPENGNSIVVNNLGLGLNSGFTAVNGAEPTFFSCVCVFTNTTEEAYVKLNGHTLYTGAEDGGLSFNDQLSYPFTIDMLLGPGDTIEISPYVQLRAIRFTGGRYV